MGEEKITKRLILMLLIYLTMLLVVGVMWICGIGA